MSAVFMEMSAALLPLRGWAVVVKFHHDGELYDYSVAVESKRIECEADALALARRAGVESAARRLFLEDVDLGETRH